MGKYNAWQAALWSIAIPGFGQLINGRYIKGLTLIGLELLINMNSGLNSIIIYSFQGQTMQAINATNYQWLCSIPAYICLQSGMPITMQTKIKHPCYFCPLPYQLILEQLGLSFPIILLSTIFFKILVF